MSQSHTKILAYFTCASQAIKHFIIDLIRDAVKAFGENTFTSMMSQWFKLGKILNSPSKLNCLHDKNHRALIIEFMNENAIEFYKCSYFNSAKIDPGYIDYLRKMRPVVFIEIIKIVSKLKLVQKHFRLKMEDNYSRESHIDEQIRMLLGRFSTPKRKINNNFQKFKAIADYEDFQGLAIELGKLLRKSWSTEKRRENEASRTIIETSLTEVIGPNEEKPSDLMDFEMSYRRTQVLIDEFFA